MQEPQDCHRTSRSILVNVHVYIETGNGGTLSILTDLPKASLSLKFDSFVTGS